MFQTQVHDIELNRELFDIPTPSLIKQDLSGDEEIQIAEERKDEQPTPQVELQAEVEAPCVEDLPEIEITNCIGDVKNSEAELIPGKGTSHPKTRRKFDSVKNLLEKARQKLLMTKRFWSHTPRDSSKCGDRPEGKDCGHGEQLLSVPDQSVNVTQSNPSTPAQLRKNFRRNRSFSPVR